LKAKKLLEVCFNTERIRKSRKFCVDSSFLHDAAIRLLKIFPNAAGARFHVAAKIHADGRASTRTAVFILSI
jgi:hypothetical protein